MDASLPDATEDSVARLVERFYDRIHADDRLGPIFAAAVPDWDRHLAVMRDFWSAVLLGTERYRGCVMSAHFGLPIQGADLDRFLALFRPIAEETLPPAAAERAIAVAQAVIDNLRRMVR